jgi:hypothetical protein
MRKKKQGPVSRALFPEEWRPHGDSNPGRYRERKIAGLSADNRPCISKT